MIAQSTQSLTGVNSEGGPLVQEYCCQNHQVGLTMHGCLNHKSKVQRGLMELYGDRLISREHSKAKDHVEIVY